MMMPSRKPKGIDVEALKGQAAARWPEVLWPVAINLQHWC